MITTLTPTIVEDATRREFIALLGAAGLLTACGSDDSGVGPEGETRSYDHVYGSTEIPVAPRRIVATDLAIFGILTAIGIRPVGAVLTSVVGAGYLQSATEGVSDVGTVAEEVNIETAAALRPDLFLAFGDRDDEYYTDQYQRLQAVAPTVAVANDPTTLDGVTAAWRTIADAAGSAERGVAADRDFRARIADLRSRIGAPLGDRTVSIVQVAPEFVDARTGFFESAVLDALGIARPPSQSDRSQGSVDISPEQIGLLDAYAIFVYARTGASDALATLQNNPLWQRLDAVASGRVFVVDPGVWNLGDPIAANAMLDDLDRHLFPLLG